MKDLRNNIEDPANGQDMYSGTVVLNQDVKGQSAAILLFKQVWDDLIKSRRPATPTEKKEQQSPEVLDLIYANRLKLAIIVTGEKPVKNNREFRKLLRFYTGFDDYVDTKIFLTGNLFFDDLLSTITYRNRSQMPVAISADTRVRLGRFWQDNFWDRLLMNWYGEPDPEEAIRKSASMAERFGHKYSKPKTESIMREWRNSGEYPMPGRMCYHMGFVDELYPNRQAMFRDYLVFTNTQDSESQLISDIRSKVFGIPDLSLADLDSEL